MELLVLAAITMAVVGLAGGIPEARRVKRELGRHRPDAFSSLAEGRVVTLHGRVVLDEDGVDLVGPITRKSCVYWRLVFEEVGVGGDARELGRIEHGRPFHLQSVGGTVRVVPGTPLLALPGAVQVRQALDLYDQTRGDGLITLARTVCKRINYPSSSSLRISEYSLAPEMEVTLRGYCTREPDPTAADAVGADYRGDAPMRFVLSGTRRARMLIG